MIEIFSHLAGQSPAIVSMVINALLIYELKKRSVISTEYKVLEDTCTRQRGEIKELNQEIGKLKERTDLQPVIEALNRHNAESNTRFDKALQIQDQQSRLLEANTEAIKALTRSHEQMIKHYFPRGGSS